VFCKNLPVPHISLLCCQYVPLKSPRSPAQKSPQITAENDCKADILGGGHQCLCAARFLPRCHYLPQKSPICPKRAFTLLQKVSVELTLARGENRKNKLFLCRVFVCRLAFDFGVSHHFEQLLYLPKEP